MKTDLTIALAVMILAMLALSQLGHAGDPYCEMRQIWVDTNGVDGWPEYEAGKDERMGCEL